jgi:predicted dehydrogenase
MQLQIHRQDDFMDKIRWGILATGNIASQFATGLKHVPDAELLAIASRSQETADAFGQRFDVPRRYATYEVLAADPDIDAVYVSTPHNFHKDNTIMCLQAGKAVLCEKPFAINARESAEMIALAREKGLFLMEAMWTRYLPVFVHIRQMIEDGVLGEIRMVMADLGFRAKFNPKGRLFSPALGGGALLDVGVYPISLASMIFGQPQQISSTVHLGQTGVDEQAAIVFGYEGGKAALLGSAINLNTPMQAIIIGTEGRIEVHPRFFIAHAFNLTLNGKEPQTFQLPPEGNGYNYEAVEVGACLRAGKLESDVMPLNETQEIMQTMDAIRAQWGLRYPGEA